MQIKALFDPAKDIYRSIETVISYGAARQDRLKAEIAEYIVTESIEDQLEKLLTAMQDAMESGAGPSQVAVWVSGFYGSGKSSLTKYLGLALDGTVLVEGVPFLKHLQDRLKRATTRALLTKVAARFPAAVVLLDLASEMLAGATMEDVATVLYYKVLQWAGYSRILKVALLEQRLQADGRHAEFTRKVEQALGAPWADVQNDPLIVDSVVPEIAHQIYPALFKSPTAFSSEAGGLVRFEDERVKEMLEIVRRKSGKQHVLFVIDEVGQYVASRPGLILNLDGLAKNIKEVAGGLQSRGGGISCWCGRENAGREGDRSRGKPPTGVASGGVEGSAGHAEGAGATAPVRRAARLGVPRLPVPAHRNGGSAALGRRQLGRAARALGLHS